MAHAVWCAFLLRRGRTYIRNNHLALIALMVAVAGVPTAWALGRNSVGSKELQPDSVGGSELKDNSVRSPEVNDGSLLPRDLACEGNGAADEMVQAPTVCIDKYEASVWSQPNGGTQLVTEAQIDAACPDNGQSCEGTIFARSVQGVAPARDITWFQAMAALANSGKRLPTNAEWQQAVTGTPGNPPAPGSEDCNTDSAAVEPAGERDGCKSDAGANDMIGNVSEWVADWDQQSTQGCASFSVNTGFEGDRVCIGDDGGGVAAPLIRGGDFDDDDGAGAMMVDARVLPFQSTALSLVVGFRGAR